MCGKGTDKTSDLFQYERGALRQGYRCIAGVDEVGRGPLAGPVVAAAVMLPCSGFSLPVRDSKSLSEKDREALYGLLRLEPGVHMGIGLAGPECIDTINILRATHRAMAEAVSSLPSEPDYILVDGLRFEGLPAEAEFIVKGDSRSASIAAASIVAKVYRDRLMVSYETRYPGYGFARNKGYGTAEHLAALTRLGVTPLHRCSFAPVMRILHPGPTQLQFSFSRDSVGSEGPGPVVNDVTG